MVCNHPWGISAITKFVWHVWNHRRKTCWMTSICVGWLPSNNIGRSRMSKSSADETVPTITGRCNRAHRAVQMRPCSQSGADETVQPSMGHLCDHKVCLACLEPEEEDLLDDKHQCRLVALGRSRSSGRGAGENLPLITGHMILCLLHGISQVVE